MTIIDSRRTLGTNRLRASADADSAQERQRLLESARERLGRVRGQMDDATFERLVDQVVTLEMRWQQRLNQELRGSLHALPRP